MFRDNNDILTQDIQSLRLETRQNEEANCNDNFNMIPFYSQLTYFKTVFCIAFIELTSLLITLGTYCH